MQYLPPFFKGILCRLFFRMKVVSNQLLKKSLSFFIAVLAVGALQTGVAYAAEVKILKYHGVINPIASEYLGGSIKKFNDEKSADLIVIMLDTPGGLDTSMRIIIKEILASSVPVVVYVAPSGSRAASAGTFIAMASHISAMAPGTSQGAAHPVAMGGGQMDKTMRKKVENDAAAYITSLANQRGRNAKWAEQAVRKSVSIHEKDALKKNVIDVVAKNMDELLEKVEGKKVTTKTGEVAIAVAGATRTTVDMTQRQKFLGIITNPTVAYILLMLGFYGLFFELSNPGVILPGIIGGICLILGFYALQGLPVNYAGVLLLALAIILFAAELFVPSFGALTIGGTVAMILGGILLIDSPESYMKVRLIVIAPIAMMLGAIFFAVVGYAMIFKPKVVPIGSEGLVGLDGFAVTALNPSGRVEVDGELWDARAEDGEIKEHDTVKVKRKEGHVLIVEPGEGKEEGL